MMKRAINYASFCLIISGVLISCRSTENVFNEVANSSPRFDGKPFVKLVKLYDLDVTRISLFSKESDEGFRRVIDFDGNDNIYILDGYESRISVFNDRGDFVRSFGRAGQGPDEFSRPSALLVKNDKILMFEGFNELKVVDLKGEYISKQPVFIENRLDVRSSGDKFYVLRGKTDPTFTSFQLILTAYDEGFVNGRDLFRYVYPPGFKGIQKNNPVWNWLFVSATGEFYFPEDNLNAYSIIKYSREGKPKLKFSRDYAVAPYSKEARARIYSADEQWIKQGGVSPQAPPVVVNMFQDQRRNIWVISGETYEDNMIPYFENAVDIFSEDGEWLSSFKTKSISKNCLCHNGRIYNVLPANQKTYGQFIEVYRIEYIQARN
jgi:hypothetical protein